MKEMPILFNGDMVRAILDGRKTQTRLAFSAPAIKNFEIAARLGEVSHFLDQSELGKNDLGYVIDFCPYGKVGDRLWVREAFSVTGFFPSQDNSTEAGFDGECAACRVHYYADDAERNINDLSSSNDFGVDEEQQALRASKKKSVPSIHMARWASRIQLEIVSVRVERLNEISEADAKAEGMKFTDYGLTCFHQGAPQDVGDCPAPDAHHQRRPGWHYDKSTHQDRCWHTAKNAFVALWRSINGTESWAENPWVWVVEFKRV